MTIQNIGEYFSTHYLESTFVNEIKPIVSQWRTTGATSPPRRLAALTSVYFRAKTDAIECDLPEDRVQDSDNVNTWHRRLLQSLGYEDLCPSLLEVEGGQSVVPVLATIKRYGTPWLAIAETHFCLPDAALADGRPSEIPLEQLPPPLPASTPVTTTSKTPKLCAGDWARCLGRILTAEEAPRWIIFLSGSQISLFDRHTYAQGRYLAFDLDDAFGRKDKKDFEAIAAILSRETLCPNTGDDSATVLLDKIEESSHRFAHGVTDSLQDAVREAIEIIVNEWARDRTEKRKLNLVRLRADEIKAIEAAHPRYKLDLPPTDDGGMEITAEHLRREALTFVYRLLFCFYAEARGAELNILPIGDVAYRLGYSLESLRDLEQVPLTPATEEGTYFQQHLHKLFKLIHEGFNPDANIEGREYQPALSTEKIDTFRIRPLTATLFDPAATPLLSRGSLRNLALQQVIAKLSLSQNSQSRSIERVNYAQLGINQLGAVYEGLLSYRGMFADRDLIQVKPAGRNIHDKKTPTWFVPKERLDEFATDEVERVNDDNTGPPVIYTKGRFILHLSGIDREQSASYYTPEVLTRSLVTEALRELLANYGPDDADKILQLKVLEPAMGSGAFLGEAAEQLATKYLELKQQQLSGSGDEKAQMTTDYLDELRRVKHYIATRNVYGVDLNATAVQLGQLSLWLGSIHRMIEHHDESTGQDTYRSGATPWFGLRLRCGNSLVGARRAVWTREQLKSGAHAKKSGENAAPRLLAPGEQRAEDEIYHFLVFDEEMVPTHRDSLMRSFHPERAEAAKTWVTRHVKPKWSVDQIATALAISDLVDQQMQRYAEARIAALAATDCTASVWPTPANAPQATDPGPKLVDQERICAELESDSSAFQRLRLVMDLWCALWFWPLEEVTSLPNREAFLESSRMLLAGEPISDQSSKALANIRLGFDIDMLRSVVGEGVPDVRQLADVVPWFTVADRVRSDQTFHHWELAFPEVLGPSVASGGFDLIVGNPPWIKASWSDGSVLAELEPMLGVKESASAAINRERPKVLSDDEGKSEQARIAGGSRGEKQCPRCFYGEAFRKQEGVNAFLNSPRLYPELTKIQTNLYKNFIVRTWGLLSQRGAVGLLHPEGPYDDANGGNFRKAIYPRLRGHYHHKNELQLFSDVHHETDYSINIYGPNRDAISFSHMSNLFHPATIAASFGHEQTDDPIPGIKDAESKWNVRPHASRIVLVTETELSLFAELLEDEKADPLSSRLPQIHSQPLVDVIRKITNAPRRLADLSGEYYATVMFDETYAQRDGITTRVENPSYQPKSPDDWVVSGPHFFVGTPLNKTPRTACTHNNAYDDIDLTVIGLDYLPRAVYRPGNESGDYSIFEESVPCWPPTRLPGLWPIQPEQHTAWEVILGQPPVIHTAAGDLSVLSISECSSDVLAALSHLAQVETPTREELAKHFPGVYAKQCEPAPGALEHLRQPITTRYRYANRRQISLGTERTVMAAIMAKGCAHIDALITATFLSNTELVAFSGTAASMVCDFLVRITGKSDCRNDLLRLLPIIDHSNLKRGIIYRTLRLNCLTAAYADLWTSVVEASICDDAFTVDGVLCESPSPQAGQDGISAGPQELAWRDLDPTAWTWNTPLRSDRARRQALIEIDVLVAMSLGLTLEELLQIYQVQFPVMQMYERVDEYDRHGRHLPNTKRKNQGGKEFRTARADAMKVHPGVYDERPADDFFEWQVQRHLPDGPPITVTWPVNDGKETITRDFHPPFFKVDREEDYRRAWEAFASKLNEVKVTHEPV